MSEFYQTEWIRSGVARIRGCGNECCYLIEGKNSALLIDSCCGYCDFPEVIQSLTDLPIQVALTHGHLDHCGGAFFYPKFGMCEKDISILEKHESSAGRAAFIRQKNETAFRLMGGEQAFSHRGESKIELLTEGSCYNLGGIIVEVWETPGHTKGCLSFVDRAHGCAFTGDNLLENTVLLNFPESDTLETYQRSVERLSALFGEGIEVFYTSHGQGFADITLVQELLRCCKEIKNGTADEVRHTFYGNECFLVHKSHLTSVNILERDDGIAGNIAYVK